MERVALASGELAAAVPKPGKIIRADLDQVDHAAKAVSGWSATLRFSRLPGSDRTCGRPRAVEPRDLGDAR